MTKTLSFLAMLTVAVAGWILLTSNIGTQAFGGEGKAIGGDREVIQEALEANDYSLLPTQVQEKISAEDFASKIEKRAEKEAYKAKIESIVAANDFVSFKTTLEAKKAEKLANKQERVAEKLASATEEEKAKILERQAKVEERISDRGSKTEDQLQEKFNEMVTYYNENWELPSRKGKRGGKKGWQRWSK